MQKEKAKWRESVSGKEKKRIKGRVKKQAFDELKGYKRIGDRKTKRNSETEAETAKGKKKDREFLQRIKDGGQRKDEMDSWI